LTPEILQGLYLSYEVSGCWEGRFLWRSLPRPLHRESHASGSTACNLVNRSAEPPHTTRQDGKGATWSAFPNFNRPFRKKILADPATSRCQYGSLGEPISGTILVLRHLYTPRSNFAALVRGSWGIVADLCHQIYDPLGYSATSTLCLLNIWSTCVVGSIWADTPKKVFWSTVLVGVLTAILIIGDFLSSSWVL
jgi:hypothetical protein